MSIHRICPKCNRSTEILERIETDKKTKKSWLITYCSHESCKFNFDCETVNVKLWNARTKYFEDLSGDKVDES